MEKAELLGQYVNGNYKVSIFSDGTKIRENDLTFFKPEFPENIDIKITDYCDAGCPFCHENSTKQGLHGGISREVLPFIYSLRPYTELAIGGGNPLSHPELIDFLVRLNNKSIISNLTVNQIHFERNNQFVAELIKKELIYGLGVSMIKATNTFCNLIIEYPNTVIHVINGVVKEEDLEKLYDKNLKLLILGYKYLRRGENYYSEQVEINKKKLYNLLPSMLKKFAVVSFDNLALEQLNVKRLVSKGYWNQFYMGDDGSFTMYVDVVKGEFAKSSTSKTRYPLTSSIDRMFNTILEEGKNG